jgi:hypothetical protein
MTTQQFVIRFFSVSLLLLVIIGLFNRIVDPFWYYRDIEIKGFNAIKPKFRRYERHIKPALLMREQPEAIILGSSYAEIGFDPTSPFFTDHGRLKSMNFALAGAFWDRVQCQFEFAVTHANIKRALVGFHPGALPMVNCAKEFTSLGQVSTGELLLSSRALMASIETIREQKKENPSHTRAGMYFYTRGQAGVDRQFRESFTRHIKDNPHCLNAANASDLAINPVADSNLDLSGLQRMIKTAQVHGVELVLFAYPSHAYSLELSKQCGELNERWRAMKSIATLIEKESKGTVSAWQFYGFNDTTTEPIGATAAKYWQDPEHFNFEMGNRMLADMFDADDNKPELGHRLSSSNIESDYRNFLQGRSEYLQHHAEFHANLLKLQ